MTSSVTYANGQQIHIDPYNGKLFDFNKHQSRVYLGRSINQLLNVFGNDCIIDGLQIYSAELSNNILSVVISPGKAILDMTLIEFTEPVHLDIDVSNIDEFSGYFVISISYNYLQDTYDNKAKFRLVFINNDNYSSSFFVETDRVILTKLIINKSKELVNYVYSFYTNPEVVTINGKDYKIFPPDSITKNIIRSIQEVFFI